MRKDGGHMPFPLDQLPLGQQAVIHSLLPHCPHRRRLMELGFLPGATVTALHQSPWGDPVAYGIAGAVIALRRTDARHLLLSEKEDARV